jgi:hypothetical protein
MTDKQLLEFTSTLGIGMTEDALNNLKENLK